MQPKLIQTKKSRKLQAATLIKLNLNNSFRVFTNYFCYFILLTLISLKVDFALGQEKKHSEKKCPEKKLLAVTQIVEHKSLEMAWKGIADVLSENGYNTGVNLEIIHKNAQGSLSNSQSIAKQFISLNPTAIVAISTPSAQSIAATIKDTDIAMVFASVADPVAAGLVKNISDPTRNITGAIDLPPTELILPLMKSVIPEIKSVGFLYNSGEANSVKTIEILKQHMVEAQIKTHEATIQNSSQLAQGFRTLLGNVDAIYIPSDNTVFAAMSTLVKMSRKHKLPVFSSDPDSIKQGILACVGYNQYEVGRTAGQKLIQILQGERKIIISHPEKEDIVFNKQTADILGIKIPEQIGEISIIVDEG